MYCYYFKVCVWPQSLRLGPTIMNGAAALKIGAGAGGDENQLQFLRNTGREPGGGVGGWG